MLRNIARRKQDYLDQLPEDVMLGAVGGQVVPALAAIILLAWPVSRVEEEAVPEAIPA